MKELDQILRLWGKSEDSGESCVLATVVKTQGSSYRLPGARLLLTRTAQHAGAVSGGCLEDDLVKKAWWLTEKGPLVRRYDTTPDGEISTGGYGLGCNGIIHVLLERAEPGNDTSSTKVLRVIRGVRSVRLPAVITHLLKPSGVAGQRLIIETNGAISHNIADTGLAIEIEQASKLALAERKPRVEFVHGETEVFIETVSPPVRLLVFGAGDDAVPLVDFAKYLGWQVFVIDGRAHYARREKFPAADEVIVRSAEGFDIASKIDPWTVAVLMTHSYSQDLETVRELASSRLRYVGLLGPRKRATQLLADAGLDDSDVAELHSPMGLDIGADGPEQVAMATIAEIQATLNGRNGGLLRERTGSIHARPADNSNAEKFWVQSITCA